MPTRPQPVRLFSPLPVGECAARLVAAVERASEPGLSVWTFWETKPVVGYFDGWSMRLRKRSGRRRSGQPLLVATIRSERGGTLIEGTVGEDPAHRPTVWIVAGIILMLGLLMLGHAVATEAGIVARNGKPPGQMGILFFLLAPVVIVGGDWLSRQAARDEPRFLVEFLGKTVDARDEGHVSETVKQVGAPQEQS